MKRIVKYDGNDKLRKKIIEFWVSENAINLEESERRVDDVIFVEFYNDEIIGLCSGIQMNVPELSGNFLYYRAYTSPKWRNMKITQGLFNETYNLLNNSETNLSGIYVVFESPILNEFNKDYVLKDYSNLTLIKINEHGQQVRVSYFDNKTITQ